VKLVIKVGDSTCAVKRVSETREGVM